MLIRIRQINLYNLIQTSILLLIKQPKQTFLRLLCKPVFSYQFFLYLILSCAALRSFLTFSWKLFIDKDIKKIDLLEKANISTLTLAKLGKDEYVSMDALVKVCTALNVNIGDIVELVEDDT